MKYGQLQMRENMVLCQIRPSDVSDERILNALYTVPREQFVPHQYKDVAYLDKDITFDSGRYMLRPAVLAKMLFKLDLSSEDVVLNVGSCMGYCVAVLAQLAKKVVAVETDESLSSKANLRLHNLGIDNAIVINADLDKGHDVGEMYDRIFINGAVTDIPDAILSQLKDGGKLVTIRLHYGNIGYISLIERNGGDFHMHTYESVVVKPLAGFGEAVSSCNYRIV